MRTRTDICGARVFCGRSAKAVLERIRLLRAARCALWLYGLDSSIYPFLPRNILLLLVMEDPRETRPRGEERGDRKWLD